MGTITARKRKDDSVAFMARVRVMRDGVTYHETETFDRRPSATSWIKKRERELAKAIVITAYKAAYLRDRVKITAAFGHHTSQLVDDQNSRHTARPAQPWNGNIVLHDHHVDL